MECAMQDGLCKMTPVVQEMIVGCKYMSSAVMGNSSVAMGPVASYYPM